MGHPSRSLEESVVRVTGQLRPTQEDSRGEQYQQLNLMLILAIF